MIQLKNKTNVTAPSGAYPYGSVKDDGGGGDGTPYDKATNEDYFQFFAKMFAESGITPNDLPENDTNGYQYYQALVAQPSWAVGVVNPIFNAKYDVLNCFSRVNKFGEFQMRGYVEVIDGTLVNTEKLVFNLPIGSRPSRDLVIHISHTNSSGVSEAKQQAACRVRANGEVHIHEIAIIVTGDRLYFEGVIQID